MNIGASQTLSGGPFLPRPAREAAVAADIESVRSRPPVERIVEGEVLGRHRHGSGVHAVELAARMRVHAQAATGPQSQAGASAALAAYAGVAAGTGAGRPMARVDLYV